MVRLCAVLLAAIGVSGCVENDCGNPNNNALYRFITFTLLDQKAREDSDSARWYWCEAPMRKRDKVPDGMLGPLVNLADGSHLGYGRWIQVSSTDASNFVEWSRIYGVLPAGDEGAALAWRYAAAARFVYQYNGISYYGSPDSLSYQAADMFSAYVRSRTRRHAKKIFPAGVRCYTVAEAREQSEDAAECVAPAANSPNAGSGDSSAEGGTGGQAPEGDWGSE
jgi:hypothetical protein